MQKSVFTEPKIVKNDDLKSPWYVFFRFEKKLFRFKGGINYNQDYNQRLIEAEALREALFIKLKKGWDPRVPDLFLKMSIYTLIEALDFAIDKKKPQLSPKTFLDYNCTLRFIKAAICALNLKNMPIVEVRRIHIKTILQKMQTQRAATNYSYNKYLSHFSAVLSELLQWDIIEINPANKIKTLVVSESRANIPATTFQHGVIKKELQTNHPNFFNFIATIFHTGIRPEEILKIKLNMIDMQRGQIILPAANTKTNKERIVPINRHLFDNFLSMEFDNMPNDYFLFGSFRRAGKGNIGKTIDFIPGPTKIKRDTATKRWHTVVKIGLGFKTVNMYSEKHAGANAKILAGIDLDSLRELYGHTSKLMTLKYATVVKELHRKQIMDNAPDY